MLDMLARPPCTTIVALLGFLEKNLTAECAKSKAHGMGLLTPSKGDLLHSAGMVHEVSIALRLRAGSR